MTPIEHTDPINARILAISEDKICGFTREPFYEIARQSNLALSVVIERIRAMLTAGTIRRVRQTLVATNLAEGALVAWKMPADRLDTAFDFMARKDPFSGHVVIRSTDSNMSGADYKLWTTVKVPVGESLKAHCTRLLQLTGAESFHLMPAKGIFALGVGHVRRKTIEPGDRSESPAQMANVQTVSLTAEEWAVLLQLKREFSADEIQEPAWASRAQMAKVSLDRFYEIAISLDRRKVIGRFSTFLEHVKPSQGGIRVTRFNGLFHWAVPKGREIEAGSEIGRHQILTHCYWREGGPEFHHVNIMAVAHGTDKERLLEHKAAIDHHLNSVRIPIHYTNVFWGGRSEIKPSEISLQAYHEWHAHHSMAGV